MLPIFGKTTCPKPRIPTNPPRGTRGSQRSPLPAPGGLDVLLAQARRGGDLLEARLAGEVAPREGTHQGQLTAALLDRANLTGLVLGCIETKFCRKICVGRLSPRSTQCTHSFAQLCSGNFFCQNLPKFRVRFVGDMLAWVRWTVKKTIFFQ